MKRYCFITINLACALLLNTLGLSAQSVYTLQQCLEYAVENNRNLKKSQYDREKAAYARQEVLGTLLPQINGTANLNDNLKKAFLMPNFRTACCPHRTGLMPPNTFIEMAQTAGWGIHATIAQF